MLFYSLFKEKYYLSLNNVSMDLSQIKINRTVGSLPAEEIKEKLPTTKILLDSFTKSYPGNEKLTVGGKAWTKHVHRSSDGYWGVYGGGAEKVSKKALDSL